MNVITLYRVHRADGGITTTPVEPEEYESTLFRIVSDDGMELVKGDVRVSCIDTESLDGWVEEGLTKNET